MVQALTLPVVVLTYIGIAIGKYPKLRMNRATIALAGAATLIVAGVMPLERATAALDADTLILLFAMMIINAHLKLAGFFGWVGALVLRFARSPRALLAWIIMASGILSALFLNDTVVLVLTPLVLEIALTQKRDPIPYLIGLVTAANIGSTATITGNPQNALIGMSSHISFVSFLASLAPVSIAGLVIAWAVVVRAYRAEFADARLDRQLSPAARLYTPLLYKTLALLAVMLLAFLAGMPVPLASLGVAAALLVTRRIKPERILSQLDWPLLIFFSGLFVVTGALSVSGLTEDLFALASPLIDAGVLPLTIVTVVLSNLVSNVPAVMLFRPLVAHLADPARVWLTLAMASTLAGNLTLIGSVANLIVAESARSRGVELSFREYLRAGVPITLLTLAVGVLWLTVL
ncbi:MAG: anion transporter [Chloroflexi bacterium]|nr:anion transporter [Chloroflexota bacterium]